MKRLRSVGWLAVIVAALTSVPGALGVPPSNDAFTTPIVLASFGGELHATNVDAEREENEPEHAGDPGGASVWFFWTAPYSAALLIDTCDSNFDTILAVYTGPALDQLTEVDANDDSCGLGSELAFEVVAGTHYRIAVDGVGGATGSFALWYALTAVNDNFANAEPIVGSAGIEPGTLPWATHELEEPRHAGELGTGSYWYVWTAPGDLRASFDACGTGEDTLLAVYTGTALGALTPVASDKDGCRLDGGLEFDAVGGQSYRIAADPIVPAIVELNWTTGPLVRNLTPPTISGAAVTNGVLTASPGTWAHATSFLYAWESCPPEGPTPGSPCRHIPTPQPSSESIRLSGGLLGRRIRAVVTPIAPNGFFSTARSAMTAPVTPGPPLNAQPPTVLGTARVGETLHAGTGAWDLGGAQIVGFTYLWQRCSANAENCRPVRGPGAAGKYLLTPADLRAVMQVVVTLTTTGGAASAAAFSRGQVGPRVRGCVVPRLVGRTLRKARRSLARAGCKLGRVTRKRSARRAGLILGQRPKPGTRLRLGARVSVRVSLGRRR